jgi:hypothetical protein
MNRRSLPSGFQSRERTTLVAWQEGMADAGAKECEQLERYLHEYPGCAAGLPASRILRQEVLRHMTRNFGDSVAAWRSEHPAAGFLCMLCIKCITAFLCKSLEGNGLTAKITPANFGVAMHESSWVRW